MIGCFGVIYVLIISDIFLCFITYNIRDVVLDLSRVWGGTKVSVRFWGGLGEIGCYGS